MKRRYLAASAAAALGATGLLGVTQVRFANASKAPAAYADLDDVPRDPLLAQAAPEAVPTAPSAPAAAPVDSPALPQPAVPETPQPVPLPVPSAVAEVPPSPQPTAPSPDVAQPAVALPAMENPTPSVSPPQPVVDPSAYDLPPDLPAATSVSRPASPPARWSRSRATRPVDSPIPDVPPQPGQDRSPQLDEEPRAPLFPRQPAPARAGRSSAALPGERSPFDRDDRPPTGIESILPTPGSPPRPGTAGEDGEALARQYVRELFLARSRSLEGSPGASPDSDPEIHQMETVVLNHIGQQFDARQRRYVDEIEALEAKVARLRALVDKRQENRDDIVRKRLNQLLSESEGLGW